MKRFFPVVFALSIAAPFFGQTPTRLAFEVASIKQEDVKLPNQITGGICHGSDMPAQVGIPGMTVALGRCRYVGATVKQLINNAYDGVAFNRISGGPGWIGSLPFTIGLAEYYRSLSKAAFTRALQKLVPEIQSSDLVPAGSGVRAQALDPRGSLLDDFCIVRSDRMIHVCNVPSPAATASLIIGKQIIEYCREAQTFWGSRNSK